MKQSIIAISMVGLVSGTSHGLSRHFSNPVGEGAWMYTGNRLMCELKQEVPSFGHISFIHEHVRPEKMMMNSWQQGLQGKFSGLYVLEPSWKQDKQKETFLTKVPMRAGKNSIVLDSNWTQSVLAYLDEGYTARFKFKSRVENKISVDISSVNFSRAYKRYAECERNLLNFTLDDVKNTTIYFPVNGTRLTKADIDHILRIREYVLADPKVTKVVVRGFSDEQGRRGHNNYLSEIRAKAVYKYLMLDNRLDKKKVSLTWYGEKYPVADNDSEIGQALNRRVTIDLYVDYP